MKFEDAFRKTQDALQIGYVAVRFTGDPGSGLLATTESDPPNCTVLVRFDRERCNAFDEAETTAVHECLHLLLADLKHAYHAAPDAIDWQEEQLVRRLEPLVHRAIFLNSLTP